jgi:hypothetical protein
MATQRREESEWRSKRQRKSVSREGGDAFKASPTRGRIKEEKFLRQDGRDEEEVNFIKDSKRPKQQN